MNGARLRSASLASLCAVLCSLPMVSPLCAQSLSVFDVDASQFPTVTARFYLFDAAGKRITVNTPSDVVPTDNGVARTVTRVSCPPPPSTSAISAVLMLDVSGSMVGSDFVLEKEAAYTWIDAFPLGESECAITSFNATATLNRDFESDSTPSGRKRLRDAVTLLSATGATNWDNALLHPQAGGLTVTKHARAATKIIVFLSDGAETDALQQSDAIVAEAHRQGVTIYGIILGGKAPQQLKDLCSRTGGRCYQNVNNTSDASIVYPQILGWALEGAPCEAEWRSDGCGHTHELAVSLPTWSLSDTLAYTVQDTVFPRIGYTPWQSVHFGRVAPPSTSTRTITLNAIWRAVRVDSVKGSDPRFRIIAYGGTAPPFVIDTGSSRTITVEFAPTDSSHVISYFTVFGNACAGSTLYADCGWLGSDGKEASITVLRPNGGEKLVVGNDELLQWEGVSPDEKVRLEYRTSAVAAWRRITDSATGLQYLWRVPRMPGDSCLLRATALSVPRFSGEMALIPAGSFRRGDLSNHALLSDEHPDQRVTITRPFLMSRTEVTQAKWRALMNTSPSKFTGDSLPVERVSWYDAIRYCNARSKLEGMDTCYIGLGPAVGCDFAANGYRLPTEAEWEYACRAGTETDFYSGDMTDGGYGLDSALDRAGWYLFNSGSTSSVHPSNCVGRKEPNAFGLYDMHGNVWEWCWDWYSAVSYSSDVPTDPCGPGNGSGRVMRGGCADANAFSCRAAIRANNNPSGNSLRIGFRVVRTY